MGMYLEPRYRGHVIRIRLTTLGRRFRAGYAIDNGKWRHAEPSESVEWAICVAEYAAKKEVDRLRLAVAC